MGTGIHKARHESYKDLAPDYGMHFYKNVYRRLNLIIYFNKNWQEDNQGNLELWNSNKGGDVKQISPAFNRCVIFETNPKAWHGYSLVNLPPDISRNTFYGNFFTFENAEEGEELEFAGDHEKGLIKKLGLKVKVRRRK